LKDGTETTTRVPDGIRARKMWACTCSNTSMKKRTSFLGSHLEIIDPFDVRSVKLNFQYALDKLGWEAKVDLNQGIKHTADWIIKRLEGSQGL